MRMGIWGGAETKVNEAKGMTLRGEGIWEDKKRDQLQGSESKIKAGLAACKRGRRRGGVREDTIARRRWNPYTRKRGEEGQYGLPVVSRDSIEGRRGVGVVLEVGGGASDKHTEKRGEEEKRVGNEGGY